MGAAGDADNGHSGADRRRSHISVYGEDVVPPREQHHRPEPSFTNFSRPLRGGFSGHRRSIPARTSPSTSSRPFKHFSRPFRGPDSDMSPSTHGGSAAPSDQAGPYDPLPRRASDELHSPVSPFRHGHRRHSSGSYPSISLESPTSPQRDTGQPVLQHCVQPIRESN